MADSKIQAAKNPGVQQVDLETAKKTAIERGPATKVLNKADLFRDKASLKAASLTAPVTQGRAVGDTCAEPKPVTDAFVDSDTTELRPDTYDDTCMGSYDSDQDIIYEWTVTADACYNVTLDPGTMAYTGFAIGTECPIGSPCVDYATNSGSGAFGITGLNLTAGTYYIQISSYYESPYYFPFTLTAELCPAGGACCHPDGSCTDEPDAGSCTGAYEGDGTSCATTDCPQPCIPDATVDFATDLPFSDLAQTTCSLGNDFSDTCLGNYDSGEEFMYELVVATETCVNITLTSDTTYTGIGVGAECPPETCLATSGTSGTGASIEALTLAPGTYYLMVDTWSTPFCIGSYDLVIAECPAGGACCHTDGSCTDEADEAACIAAGGAYEGGGTACLTADCPQPGRCCYDDGGPQCADILETECDALGGAWDAGLDCTTACPVLPPNDECVDAIAIGEVTDLPFDTTLATDGTPSVNMDMCQNIWYCYTPSVSGFLTVDLCGSTFDTQVTVWEGCACDPTVELAYDDDDCPSKTTRSLITGEEVAVVAGQQYLIEVGGYDGYSGCAVGPGTMTVSVTAPPEPWACCRDYNASCEEVLESACDGANDTWYDGQLCAEVTCPEPPATGACCEGALCTDNVFEVDCAGIWFGGQACVDVEPCPSPGDSCALPLAVSLGSADLPYSDSNTNCGRGNNYSDTCLGSYDGGEDIIYEITVTEDLACVDIAALSTDDPALDYLGVAISTDCPGSDPCLATNTAGYGDPEAKIEGLALTAGTYYIMVDTFPAPACLPNFDLTIVACGMTPGACCVDGVCAATNTLAECDGLGGTWYQGEDCATFECPTDPCDGAIYNNGTYDLAGEGALRNNRNADGTDEWRIVDDVHFAYDVRVQDLHWFGNEPIGFNWSGQTADWIILTDVAGAPGTVVASGDAAAATRIDTGEVMFGDPVWQYSIDGLDVVLAAGDYWFGMRPVQDLPIGTGDYDVGWWVTAINNGTSLYYVDDDPADVYLIGETYEAMAFCVTGEVIGTIPEGACCDDSTGVCTDPVLETECQGASERFMANETCLTAVFDPPCGTITGACCHPDATCDITTALDCADNWLGANTTCDECPCIAPCPAGSTIEAEACGAAENDGCNMTVPVMDPISCGETICGTAWADGSSRDTDWFEIVVTEPTVFTFSGVAENFSMAIGMVDIADCELASQLDPFASGVACDELSITTECLAPGTYWFFAAPSSYYDVWPCDANYYVELTCEAPCVIPMGACCQSDGTCTEEYEENCTGTYAGDDTLCSSNGICEGACCAPDGSCTDTFEDDCAGVFEGIDTECATYTCPVVPDNDLCENAIDVGTLPASVQVDNTAATDGGITPCGLYSEIYKDVWYTVVGDGSTFTASTCNEETLNGDTKISVFCGDCDYLVCVVGNDDDSGCTDKNYLSTLSWCTEDGVTYYILVGSYDASYEGLIQLDVSKDGVPCVDPVDCTIPSGACCVDSTCSVERVDICVGMGGIYVGDGVECDPNPCSTGACCLNDAGDCSDLSEVDCIAAGGAFEGAGTNCATTTCPTPGDDCTAPLSVSLALADLPWSNNNTNCGRGDVYDDPSTTHCLYYYDSGEDMIYELVVTEAMDVNIILDPGTTTYPGVAIGNVCPPTDDCIGAAYSSLAELQEIECVHLEPGTYYIQVDTWSSPDCIPDFTLTVEVCEPCVVECVGTPEAEICSNGTNDGCADDDPTAVEPIACDETICGNAWSNSELRDIDMYEITVTENTIITFNVEAEFDVVAQLGAVGATCDDYVVLASGEADDCDELILTTECLPAGTYWFLVAPADWFDPAMPCDGESSQYRATLTCETACVIPTGACCQTDGTCAEVYEEDCVGTYLGDDTICEAGTCLGACCEPDGTCTDGSEDDCAFAFQGVGTDCATTDCPIVPVNDTCGGAIEVGCDTVLVGQDITLATNQYSPGEYPTSCTGYSAAGHDLTYVITFAAETEATITVANATYDSALYVVTDCADTVGTCVVGADANVSTRDSETLTYTFPAGTYYIIVDAYSATAGTFDLEIVADCGCCDLQPDGACNSDDYWAFTDTMGSCLGSAKFNPLADLDGDECITLVDYQLWLVCYRAERARVLVNPGSTRDAQLRPVQVIDGSDAVAPAAGGRLTEPRDR